MQLDQMVVTRFRRPILRVWEAIAYDAEEIVGSDNDGAMELCLDAGRLIEFADDNEADALLESLCGEHGVERVFDFLSANISLV